MSPTADRPSVVVALGGNALAPPGERATIYDQFRHTRESLGSVVALARAGWRIALTHGNGPQVGDELLRNELAAHVIPENPLGVLVAATQGWIGYMIQQSLQNALARHGVRREVVSVVTQVVADPDAPETREPRKFIGRALDDEAAERLRRAGWTVARDDRGVWRRVVPSPEPLAIVEREVIRALVAQDVIVVAAGGGGAPVYRHPTLGWEGIDAVVDKDRAAAILARDIGARVLLILTDVDGVYRGFGTPRAERIPRLTVAEAQALVESGAVGAGTMRPKLEAAIRFLRDGGERAVIARLDRGWEALRGETGTEIR
jgi:carbamate kinase